MAWYEMNAGGIPASLKSDMNSVLNKKFGTVSQNYPPNGWPADVNLMGPLPEKTASGAIASFPDGADTVPVKSCKVAFGPGGGGGTPADPVLLVGYSGVNVTKTGKNLFDKSAVTDNTWIIVNSTETEATVSYRTSDYIRVEAGKRYWVTAKSSNRSAYYDTNKNGIAYFSFTGGASFQALYDGYIRITINNLIDLDTFIIAEGSTEPTYEAYKGETISDTFGQTVLGGQRDLTTGGMISDMDSGTMTYAYLSGLSSDYIGYTASVSAMSNHPCIWVRNWNYSYMPTFRTGGIKCKTNAFPDIHINDSSIISTQYRLYFDVTGCNISSVQDFLDAVQAMEQNGESLDVAYELATPVDITGLTAHDIETNYADNNFYADIPDSTMTVEYRADIPLALNT